MHVPLNFIISSNDTYRYNNQCVKADYQNQDSQNAVSRLYGGNTLSLDLLSLACDQNATKN